METAENNVATVTVTTTTTTTTTEAMTRKMVETAPDMILDLIDITTVM